MELITLLDLNQSNKPSIVPAILSSAAMASRYSSAPYLPQYTLELFLWCGSVAVLALSRSRAGTWLVDYPA